MSPVDPADGEEANGWIRVTIDDDPPFYVRVQPNERGRFEIVGLRLEPGKAIDSTTLRELQLARVEATVNAPALREGILNRLKWEEAVVDVKRPRAGLRVPTTNPKPASFYMQVARRYVELAKHSNRPVLDLAVANQVPWSTAQRWVKRARQLGYLGPGQKGRRG
jgi:hypothetical protein